jgi:hypothetical protein
MHPFMLTSRWVGFSSVASVLTALSFLPVQRAAGEPSTPVTKRLAVRVTNRSEPVLCAEKDNVALTFQSPEARRFTIEAAHPNYVNMLQRDNWEADWTQCDMTGDRAVPAQPRKVKLFESPEMLVVGYTLPSFWRKNETTVRIGDKVETGLHLVQLFLLVKGEAEEIIAVYPPDGYWRARPLPPEQLKESVYGSSFIVGPVDQDGGRPVANIKQLAFDPKTRSFALQYVDGSSAELKITVADHNRIVMQVQLDRAVSGKRPFAALRSMYITEYNADVARIAVKDPAAKGWREQNIMAFDKAQASDVWAGRLVPSRHNTSAPDMVFHDFLP